MKSASCAPWYAKAENVWLVIAVFLGLLNFGLILLYWNMGNPNPDWNSIAISLTVLEIFLALVAIAGFWLLRGEARAAAADEARSVAAELRDSSAKRAEEVARSTAIAYMKALNAANRNGSTSDSVTDMMQALDSGEGGNDED